MTGRDDDPADRSLRDWIVNNSFDVFGISEVNKYWPRVKKGVAIRREADQLVATRRRLSQTRFQSNRKKKKRSIRQYGRTVQISVDAALTREFERGEDFQDLG